MKKELGNNWETLFDFFDREPFAAASLGQVHKAKHNEKDIVCKLQYPDMLSIVEADISQLKLLFSIYKKIDKTIDTSEIQEEISSRVREELDYTLEKKHIELFQEIFASSEEILVPKVFEKFSTERLLTMNFLEGKKLLEYKNRSKEDRKKLAINMFNAWYFPFYKYGIIHGDPHLGNYSANENLQINLLDFGCIRVFKPTFVNGVINLYHAIMHDDEDLAVSAYESWGFENINKELINILNIWAKFLYSPLLENKVRKMQETNSTAYGAEAANKVHRELKKIGGVKPPKEFVFMDRAAIGLGSVFLHLNAELNWYKIFNQLIEGFNQNKMKSLQKTTFEKIKLQKNY